MVFEKKIEAYGDCLDLEYAIERKSVDRPLELDSVLLVLVLLSSSPLTV